jgi:hypothetical protein
MSTGKQNWSIAFYWIGVAMTLACFSLVLAGNTEFLWRFEHAAFPVSWMVAGGAVISFLLAEFGSHASVAASAPQKGSPLVAELEAAEF